MTTDIVTRDGSDLTISPDQRGFTDQQVAALRQLGLDKATDGDLAIFFHQSQRTGLDPFARQIYMIARSDSQTRSEKFTIQTGIDGLRLVARRAADQRGETLEFDDTLWCGPDGHWADVWLKPEPPAAAKAAVRRNGARASAVALFREYAGTKKDGGLTRMWATKGALMIAKCAEALALRKAFPQDLSGIYSSDEMAAADNPPMRVIEQARDWVAEAEAKTTVDEVRATWAEASHGGATQDQLTVIGEIGKRLAEAHAEAGEQA